MKDMLASFDRYPAMGVAVVYTGLGLVGGIPLHDQFVLLPAVSLIVPAGILLGLAGACGGAVGHLLVATISGGFGLASPFEALAIFLLGGAASVLWSRFERLVDDDRAFTRLLSRVVQFEIVSLFAVLTAASVLGWGYEVTGHTPFYTTLFRIVDILLVTAVLGPVWIAIGRTLMGLCGDSLGQYERPESRSAASVFLVLPPVWLGLGSSISLGYRSTGWLLDHIGPRFFQTKGVGWLLMFYDETIFGRGGVHMIVVLGAFVLASFLLALSVASGYLEVSAHGIDST